MLPLRSVFHLLCIILLCSSAALVSGQRPRTGRRSWQTLSGNAPLVVAQSGFSGVFPGSSDMAYELAVKFSLPNMLVSCDVHLTRDGDGICSSDILLNNVSDIDRVYPNKARTYTVNGVPRTGYFSSDITTRDLQSASLKQGIYRRAPNYDTMGMSFLSVTIAAQASPNGLWLNVPYDQFYRQRNLNMTRYILSVSKRVAINYASSPEVGFLRSIASLRGTKRIFQVLDRDAYELTTNTTFSEVLNNLTFVSTFADGIVVPKTYIWPVDNMHYLLNHTSLVMDAHRAGLEVFVSGFANDAFIPYDFNYDPMSEYLSFIDNGRFSVDGVISDFPNTPSATIDCYAHIGRNATALVNITVISNEGASGEYPGCSDKAYTQAVSDGADVIDCPVQMSSDGIPFCLGSINLRDRTTVAQSIYSNRAMDNPVLNITDGIFAYSLTWNEIKDLNPAMFSPYGTKNFNIFRNPRASKDTKPMRLSDFLEYAINQSSVSGVIIGIENATYLATNQRLGIIDAVLNSLAEAGYNRTATKKRVLIKSTDSSVLKSVKSRSHYELVYVVDEDIRDILPPVITDISRFANSVVISKKSVFPTNKVFLMSDTDVVSELQRFNLSVYVQIFRNEFSSQAWDFFGDPYFELNTFVLDKKIDGVITDYPATAARYRTNRCLRYSADNSPAYSHPIPPGSLVSIMAPVSQPPAKAPYPILTEDDVIEPPLPPVVAESSPPVNTPAAPGPTLPSGQPTLVASTFLSGIAILLLLLLDFVL